MIVFAGIVSIIYIWDLIKLIQAKRIRDIIVLSLVALCTYIIGFLHFRDPQQSSFIRVLLKMFKIDY